MSPKLSPILRGGFDAHMLSLSNSSRGRLRLPLLDRYSMEMIKTHCVYSHRSVILPHIFAQLRIKQVSRLQDVATCCNITSGAAVYTSDVGPFLGVIGVAVSIWSSVGDGPCSNVTR
jgi:hypothetical protein